MISAMLAPFPLTPALSLRQREPQGTRADRTTPVSVRPSLAAMLPLPAGEGRGEGQLGQVCSEASDLVAPLPLASGFSRVSGGMGRPNCFSGLAGCVMNADRKQLNRFPRACRPDSRLQPGASETRTVQTT